MDYSNLSAKQKEILECIKEGILSHGYPPTVREICEAVGLRSTSSVHSQLEKLENMGFIRRDNMKTRAIELVTEEDVETLPPTELSYVPIFDNVAAGAPIDSQVESVQDYFPMPVDFLPNANTFFAKIKGDSMINVGIFNGDLVLVEECKTAKNGDIVLARTEEGYTVKRFFKENGHYRLQPENDELEPIIVNECSIAGKVISLFRKNVI